MRAQEDDDAGSGGHTSQYPGGMAVGVVFAGFLAEKSGITLAAALALSLGIAIQNFPESDHFPATSE